MLQRKLKFVKLKYQSYVFSEQEDVYKLILFHSSILHNWITSPESPPSGSLVKLITKGGKTETVIE